MNDIVRKHPSSDGFAEATGQARKNLTLRLFIAMGAGLAHAAWAAEDNKDSWQPYVADSITYDSNLFRLSHLQERWRVLGHDGASKQDFINQASIGSKFRKEFGRQLLELDVRVDDNHYANNTQLDHMSTRNSAVWKWALGNFWSGRAGAEFVRSLATYGNSGFVGKDLLEQPAYFVEAGYAVTPRWTLTGGMRWAETLHSAAERESQNVEVATGTAGVTYRTPREDILGIVFRHGEGDFPQRTLQTITPETIATAQDTAYTEDTARFTWKYAYSVKTTFDGEAGYLQRTHPHLSFRDYSGEVWRFGVAWTPTAKTRLGLSAWHELQSWAELASNYYVSEGVSLTPAWAVTEKVNLTAQVRWESLDYAGSTSGFEVGGKLLQPLQQLRQDERFTSQLAITYRPANFAELSLAYSYQQRDSNRLLLDYRSDGASASVRLNF